MKIPEEVGSKYRFIVLAGQRVAQLQRGARPRVEEEMKMTRMATRELMVGKLKFHKVDLEKDEQAAEVSEVAES